MKKRENFYRRDPGLALAGMAGMSLEERGVYNTVLDLLYLTWRPVEDNAAYIAAHCGCAVQKLNPIIARLVERGKLLRFTEGGQSFISNPAFEAEREAVKGPSKSRSGRREAAQNVAQVEEKSGGVEEKSAGVSQNPGLLDIDREEKQPVAALERVEKSRKEDPLKPPKGGNEDLFGEEPEPKRSRRKAATPIPTDFPSAVVIVEEQQKARQAGANVDATYQAERFRNWALGKDARYADWPATWRNWMARAINDAPKTTMAAPAVTAIADPAAVWNRRITAYRANAYWNRLEWGPPPGKPGCTLSAETLMANGYMPAPAEGRVA